MYELIELFPFIKQTMLDLEKQNKFMNKVTLTGKINALDVAANLFAFTDKTALIFDELKSELIAALLNENINKVSNELSFKAKTTIDILIRNLFERTADVGFLSTDTQIVDFLTTESVSKKSMHLHLQEYAAKYSVYNEIVIFDTQGNARINLNEANPIRFTKDSIIQEALHSQEYIEQYAYSDIYPSQNKTLIYAQKITSNQKNIGVLCLCFKFEDELKSIFSKLSHNKEILSISNSKEVLASNTISKHISYNENDYTILQNSSIAVTKKTSGYQGYRGINNWFATAVQNARDIELSESSNEDEAENYSNLLSEELHLIIEKANNILEDIADVIINGELIASKQKVYLLTPILDNLRTISSELLGSIKTSIKNLEHVVKDALIHDAKMAAHLAVDIMDRNLYERANDSRWWALTELFKDELSSDTPDVTSLNERLAYINNLYTVYTNIIIFDKTKTIIAASNNHEIIGKTIDKPYIDKTLQNSDSQHYFVSDFQTTELYENEASYIYAASIVNTKNIVGGIAVVFDAKAEFKAMLDDSFPETKQGFMCFIDANKVVISSNNTTITPLSTLDIDDAFIQLHNAHAYTDFINFQGENYILASALSTGYREYKQKDNYDCKVYCLTFIKI